MRAILSELELQAETTLDDRLPAELWPPLLERAGAAGVLRQVLARWAAADPAPLVLLIDEIDALVGDTLIAAVAGRLRRPPAPLPAVRHPVRGARRARLPHSLHRRDAGMPVTVWGM